MVIEIDQPNSKRCKRIVTATFMATSGGSAIASPKSTDDKPVIVRIRRNATQSRLHAFWLEINERPLKQPLLDFEKLSISDSSGKQEMKARKVFVQHVETVTTSEVTGDIVKLFTWPAFVDVLDGETKSEECRSAFKEDNALVKSVRFEQIRSRKVNREKLRNNTLQEVCHFYDIVRVDVEEQSNEVQKHVDAFMKDCMPKQDDYVYDYYTVNNDMNLNDKDASNLFPCVQVDDDKFCYVPDESEYDNKVSNAEDNPQMDCANESPSVPTKPVNEKPVIVRVKRKATQACLDALWLEIRERPLKRPLLEFEKLPFSDSLGKDEIKARKVFVQRMETVATSEVTIDIVKLFMETNSADLLDGKTKCEERRLAFKKNNSRDHNLSKARQQHEVLAENARFEQIWRSRKANKKEIHDKTLCEMCQFYDIVRVDLEDRSDAVQKQGDTSVEDHVPKKDDYAYDYYTINNDMNVNDKVALYLFPRIQVDDEDFRYGSDESEYDSEESNDEDNSQSYYPYEMSDDDDDEDSNAEEDDPQNNHPNEMSDVEEDLNAEDNPRNNHPNEMSDKEDNLNDEDNQQNDYPNETFDDKEDSNDYSSEMFDEAGDSNVEDNSRNEDRNDMYNDKEEEEEERVEIKASGESEADESESSNSSTSSLPSNVGETPRNDHPQEMSVEAEEDGMMDNQVLDESDDESENSCSIASRDVEQFSEDGIYYGDYGCDDTHCDYYENDDDDDDYYQNYSDDEDW